jgi:hypothetical protein
MKVKQISFSIDKKLSANYNSVGMQIGVVADVEEGSDVAATAELRKTVETILDDMIIDSLQGLAKLASKAKK